jgi:hypothetical protein
MSTIEVWAHPFLSQGIAVDQAKSSVLLPTGLARREDTQSWEPAANGMAMSNNGTISFDCIRNGLMPHLWGINLSHIYAREVR